MTTGKGRAGRIRSNATTASVQAAALDLVRELAPSRVTIDGIATTDVIIDLLFSAFYYGLLMP
jgi:hypothetical protein